MNEPFDEGFILRYFLGDLSEQEQVELEDRAFSDAQSLQNILAVEADLIDEYVRGGLRANDRRKFESRFLASSERRQKVEFARAFAMVAQGSVLTETVRRRAVNLMPNSRWRSFVGSLQNAGPGLRLSLAAASLVLMFGISFLTVEMIKAGGELRLLQKQQETRQQEQQDLERQIADARSLSRDSEARLQNERRQRERSEELTRELEREREESANRPSQPSILSFALLPGLSRSGGVLPKLVVPQVARLVRLQIGIEPGDDYKSFRVELQAQGGQQIWKQDNLSARTTRAGHAVVLSLPVRLLGAGKFELGLEGITEQGKTEDVGYYYFEVIRK